MMPIHSEEIARRRFKFRASALAAKARRCIFSIALLAMKQVILIIRAQGTAPTHSAQGAFYVGLAFAATIRTWWKRPSFSNVELKPAEPAAGAALRFTARSKSSPLPRRTGARLRGSRAVRGAQLDA